MLFQFIYSSFHLSKFEITCYCCLTFLHEICLSLSLTKKKQPNSFIHCPFRSWNQYGLLKGNVPEEEETQYLKSIAFISVIHPHYSDKFNLPWSA
jgi:hypothetical protein